MGCRLPDVTGIKLVVLIGFTRLKVQILVIFWTIFGICLAFRFGTSLWPRTMIFLLKFSPIYVLSRDIKAFML